MNRTELTPRKPEALAQAERGPELRPFAVLPPEVQRPAVELWSVIRTVKDLESPSAVITLILNGIASGLHREDVSELLRRLKHPFHAKDVKFASDFTSKFQSLAADLIERRETNVTMKRIRGELPDDDKPANGQEIKALTSRLLANWNAPRADSGTIDDSAGEKP